MAASAPTFTAGLAPAADRRQAGRAPVTPRDDRRRRHRALGTIAPRPAARQPVVAPQRRVWPRGAVSGAVARGAVARGCRNPRWPRRSRRPTAASAGTDVRRGRRGHRVRRDRPGRGSPLPGGRWRPRGWHGGRVRLARIRIGSRDRRLVRVLPGWPSRSGRSAARRASAAGRPPAAGGVPLPPGLPLPPAGSCDGAAWRDGWECGCAATAAAAAVPTVPRCDGYGPEPPGSVTRPELPADCPADAFGAAWPARRARPVRPAGSGRAGRIRWGYTRQPGPLGRPSPAGPLALGLPAWPG